MRVASFSRLKLAHGGVKACNGRFESVRDGQKIQPDNAFNMKDTGLSA